MTKPPPEDAGNSALLAAAERKVESQLVPKNLTNYHKIVVAGMHLAMQGGQGGIMYQLKNSKDPIYDAASGAVGMVLMLRKQARGNMPIQAMVPAGMTLMLKALGFADRTGIAKVDQPALVRATHIFTSVLFRAFKITPQMMNTAAHRLHNMTQNPVMFHKMEIGSGAVALSQPAGQPAGQQPGSLINGGA